MQAMKIKTLKEIIKNLDPNLTIVVASCDEDIEGLNLNDDECIMLISFKDLTDTESSKKMICKCDTRITSSQAKELGYCNNCTECDKEKINTKGVKIGNTKNTAKGKIQT